MNADVSSESEHLHPYSFARNAGGHVAKCEERYKTLELRPRVRCTQRHIMRLERALYWIAAVLMTGMATIIFKLFLLVQEIG
jgi:hypothetical protein